MNTIAAIATGLTESGIGIVRISGPESYEIIGRIFVSKKGHEISLAESHRIHYGFILDYVSRETLDEVLVMNMKAPRSYTGEDTVEINCHGGVLMMKKILRTVLAAGARLAEPGEFTKRAFLNGRIDLSQAEAVIDLIEAKNDRALRAGVKQLRGDLSREIASCRSEILEATAYIEAALDDPEHISLDGFSHGLSTQIAAIRKRIERLILTADNGRMIREGIQTVILGKPNAGKSSLLNALLREDRAIVTEVAGTTRDTLEAELSLHGLSLNIIDTAGIRDTEDTIERIGVARALQAAENADLLIYVVDASVPLDASDAQMISFIKERKKPCIALLNKSDLKAVTTREMLLTALHGDGDEAETDTEVDKKQKENQKKPLICLSISAKEGAGLEQLTNQIVSMFEMGEVNWNDELCITSMRQREALEQTADALEEVLRSIDAGMPEDFYTIDLMEAYRQLGQILGKEVSEDLVNEIFGKFCMGK